MKWWERREIDGREVLDSKSERISEKDWWELWLRLVPKRLVRHVMKTEVWGK